MPDPSNDDAAPAPGPAPAAAPAGVTAEDAPPTAEEQKEIDDEVRRGRVELLAAVLLGLAGALTAFSAYKAALTDGDALAGYTESTKATSEANSFYDDYGQTYFADQSLFLDYQLTLRTDEEGAQAIRDDYFSEQLEAATVAWEEAPEEERTTTALGMDEYTSESFEQYGIYSEEADAKFEEGATADAAGDKFELANVFFAVSLFMAGVAALFRKHPVRYFALGLSLLSMIPGVISMIDGQSALG